MDDQVKRIERPVQQGFTLIEIMVVVVIIGILAAAVVPAVIDRIEQAQINRTKQDVRAFESTLQLYKMDNFKYPTTDQGLQALVQPPAGENFPNYPRDGYMQSRQLKKDPWGSEYIYAYPGEHGRFDICSYGADGLPGGEEGDADICNYSIDQ